MVAFTLARFTEVRASEQLRDGVGGLRLRAAKEGLLPLKRETPFTMKRTYSREILCPASFTVLGYIRWIEFCASLACYTGRIATTSDAPVSGP